MCSKLKSHPSLAPASNLQLMCLPFQALSNREISLLVGFQLAVAVTADYQFLVQSVKDVWNKGKYENVCMQTRGERQKQPLTVHVAKCCFVNKRTATQEIQRKVTSQSENCCGYWSSNRRQNWKARRPWGRGWKLGFWETANLPLP